MYRNTKPISDNLAKEQGHGSRVQGKANESCKWNARLTNAVDLNKEGEKSNAVLCVVLQYRHCRWHRCIYIELSGKKIKGIVGLLHWIIRLWCTYIII